MDAIKVGLAIVINSDEGSPIDDEKVIQPVFDPGVLAAVDPCVAEHIPLLDHNAIHIPVDGPHLCSPVKVLILGRVPHLW